MKPATPSDLSAAIFQKSTHSGPQGNECIEIARISNSRTLVRDSKHADTSPILTVSASAFSAFLTTVKAFDA